MAVTELFMSFSVFPSFRVVPRLGYVRFILWNESFINHLQFDESLVKTKALVPQITETVSCNI
jgi:hypothetical protein